MRHQHLFLKNEVDVELNQLNGNTTITHGSVQANRSTRCPLSERLANVNPGITQVSIFHVPFGVNDLTAGFQPNTDATFACYNPGASVNWPCGGRRDFISVTLSPLRLGWRT
ncbi:MAG: hypothetical protein IPH53_18625 [Flavobacteriales bacterium]|nr:hypothetical protein [Flavobacteriales bacterium]